MWWCVCWRCDTCDVGFKEAVRAIMQRWVQRLWTRCAEGSCCSVKVFALCRALVCIGPHARRSFPACPRNDSARHMLLQPKVRMMLCRERIGSADGHYFIFAAVNGCYLYVSSLKEGSHGADVLFGYGELFSVFNAGNARRSRICRHRSASVGALLRRRSVDCFPCILTGLPSFQRLC